MPTLSKSGISYELERAEEEAQRFLKSIVYLRNRLLKDERVREYGYLTGCKETSAVRRASLDLSRALSEVRKS